VGGGRIEATKTKRKLLNPDPSPYNYTILLIGVLRIIKIMIKKVFNIFIL
jgi:hypothetical protein